MLNLQQLISDVRYLNIVIKIIVGNEVISILGSNDDYGILNVGLILNNNDSFIYKLSIK